MTWTQPLSVLCSHIQCQLYGDCRCTGVSARWCPIHGDCVCSPFFDYCDPHCPLHGCDPISGTSLSDHGEAHLRAWEAS